VRTVGFAVVFGVRPSEGGTSSTVVASDTINRLDLARVLLMRQLKLLAKRTIFGVLLPIAIPVILFLLYMFVFHTVLKVDIPRYPVYLFAGLLPWTYLSQTLGVAVTAVSREAELVRRARFPYALLPMASTGAGLAFLIVTLVGFVVVLAGTGHVYVSLLPLLVLPVLAVYLFVTGLSLVLALVDVYNRDLRQLLSNIITVWFFLVPVVYTQTALSKHLGIVVNDDPVSFIVGEFREFLYWGHVGSLGRTVEMMSICAGFFLVCFALFRRMEPSLAKDV
jgi:lipopolysaccharide transport system permease protein